MKHTAYHQHINTYDRDTSSVLSVTEVFLNDEWYKGVRRTFNTGRKPYMFICDGERIACNKSRLKTLLSETKEGFVDLYHNPDGQVVLNFDR